MLLWKSIIFTFFVLGLAFFSCDFGQRLTNKFDGIIYDFGQLDWYLFPIEILRMLPTILVGVQEPIVIECFGIISGSRDQFKKVKSNS